jgi:hypothetical protein
MSVLEFCSMTTLPRYSGATDIFRQLEQVRARRWTLGLSAGLLAAATVVIVCVLVAAVALGYWPDQPPAALRWAVLAGALTALLASAGWFVLRPAVWKQNPAQTARFVETRLPELRNDLINTVLLCGDESQSSPELVQLAIYEALLRSRGVDVRGSVSRRSLGGWALAAGVAAALLAGFAALQPGPMRRGIMAAIAPTAYVERFNRIELLGISPADGDTCFVGEPVNIVATIANPDRAAYPAEVIFKDLPARAMSAGENFATFVLAGQKFEQSFEFAVRVGPSRWPADKPYYKVNVLQRVRIDGLDLHYEYPSYTALKGQTVRNAPGAIEAPVGTRVTVTLRTGSAVKSVLLERQDSARLPMAPAPDGRSFAANIAVLESGAYRVVIEDTRQQLPDPESGGGADGFAAGGPAALRGYFPINAIPDAPPKIEFITPNHDCDLAPGAKLPTLIRVSDNYGLTDARFYAGKQGSECREVHGFSGLVSGKIKADLPFTLEMPPGTVKGDVIVYYATVTDNRSLPKVAGPQTTASQRFKVTVQDAAEVAAEKAKRYDELRARLTAILQWQLAARVDTGICWKKHKDLPALAATAKTVQAAQKRIRADLLNLAEKFPFDKDMTTIQQAVAMLANNEARLAADQAGVLAQLADLARRDKSCQLLSATQGQIIDALETMLAILPSLSAGLKEKENGPKAGDLPPEALEKLKALDEKLAAFLDDQKKVIAATERLNKKPVDALTAEDEKTLKDLAAVEDKWEKFMDETFADFSRLVEQDFANPSTLKELLAVKSDITMAKDALSKKATEVATAAEDGALGGGEEIKDNLEKWLPDTPDRIKWAMESMPDDQGKIEAPELPKELEDLVGDLLEQEEELFDDMEDLSARAASSGSDGMGWDAMDGPISNMGAQGVTGNQLPNNNELQGRSGQGRSGKSSGEFVGDSAEDKGGRRTPTRVTPEPFQTGQVDDKSKEPPGGATGGGKLSGSGEEGLEGPVPPEIAKEMPRLAQKQAALVNKAERMRGQFQVNNYAGFNFLQAITLMNRVQRDLDKGRYQNVLRAREQTISALKQSKLRIGQIDVARDTSAEMPKYIRDDIADAMKGKLPSEFRDVLEQYYRRLSETAPAKP